MLLCLLWITLAVAPVFPGELAMATTPTSTGKKREKATTMEILKVEIPKLFRKFEQDNDGRALKQAVRLLSVAEPEAKAGKAEILAILALKLRLIFATYNYLDAKLIPDFDLGKEPLLSVAPPASSGLPAGVAPASIKDPAIRAQYERDLAENQARTKQYYLQADLRDVERECTKVFEAEIALHAQRYSPVALGNLIEETVRSKQRVASLKRYIHQVPGQAP
jgi:hypothetical protein